MLQPIVRQTDLSGLSLPPESEGTLIKRLLDVIVQNIKHDPRDENVSIAIRILKVIVDEHGTNHHCAQVAQQCLEDIRADHPEYFPKMYRTGREIFEGHRIERYNKCSICSHPQRTEIDTLLLAGVKYSELSLEFFVSESALGRHKRVHLEVGDSS